MNPPEFVRRHPFPVALALAFALALGVRLINLDRVSLWLDEILQLRCTTGAWSRVWECSPPDKPPLDYYIQWLLVRGGSTEFSARLHSALIGSLAVAALGLWARVMGGMRLSLIAMALAAPLPLMVRYAQEGRSYSLLLLAESLFLAAFWTMLRSRDRFRPMHWLAIAAAAALCVWSHYLTLVPLVLAFLFIVVPWLMRGDRVERWRELNRRCRWRIALPAMAALVAALVALPLTGRAGAALQEDFFGGFGRWSWKVIGQYLDTFSQGQGYEWSQFTPRSRFAFFLLTAVALFGWGLRRGTRKPFVFCLSLFAFAFFGTFVIFRIIDHWMEVRYVLAALPPAILLAAMGVESLGRAGAAILKKLGGERLWPRSAIDVSIVSCLCTLYVVVQFVYVLANPVQRPDWRGAAQRFQKETAADSVVVASDRFIEAILNYYMPRYDVPARLVATEFDNRLLLELLNENDDVWIPVKFPKYDRAPVEYHQTFTSLPEDLPALWGLEIRRNFTSDELLADRPELRRAIFGDGNPDFFIHAGRRDCPWLGYGWAMPEQWGDAEPVRAIDGPAGEVLFMLETPRDLTVSIKVRPFVASDGMPPKLSLRVNDFPQETRDAEEGWDTLTWRLNSAELRPGLNRMTLIPTHTVRRRDLDPPVDDARQLSFWVEWMLLQRDDQ